MIGFYIIAAIVGGGLVLVSAFFGHGEHGGGDHDVHLDHDTGHVDANLWLPFFSLRFWTYFLAAFGVSGFSLAKLTALGEPNRALLSALTGVGVGLLVTSAMRLAKRMEADSNAKTDDFLGSIGKVVVAIRPDSVGKIRVNLKGDIIELLALPTDAESLEIGDDAVVVSMEGDRARVMSQSTLMEETHLNA